MRASLQFSETNLLRKEESIMEEYHKLQYSQ